MGCWEGADLGNWGETLEYSQYKVYKEQLGNGGSQVGLDSMNLWWAKCKGLDMSQSYTGPNV